MQHERFERLEPRGRDASTEPRPVFLVFCLLLLIGCLLPASAAADERSWQALEKLRTTLEQRSPLTATFEQSMVPLGFEQEDAMVESGRLSMDLPSCLRWDYLGEFEKSFLLCGQKAYYWNPGETVGQVFDLEAGADTPGLDFFLRSKEHLQRRYKAQSRLERQSLIIDLEPLVPSSDVVALQVTLNQQDGLMQSLSYEDAEGSRTTFELQNFSNGVEANLFAPPPEVTTWEEQ